MLICPVCKCAYESVILDNGALDECPRGHYSLKYEEGGFFSVYILGVKLEYVTGQLGYRDMLKRRIYLRKLEITAHKRFQQLSKELEGAQQ